MDDWKCFSEKQSDNILHIEEKEIFPAFISKINSNSEKQIILFMIPN